MIETPENHTDIKSGGWCDRLLPPSVRPYAYLMRLDRPIGWWLLLLPGWWAIALASGGISHMTPQSWSIALLFLIGAILMRGAGCIINDLWDRDIDRQVERTRSRPLASGQLSMRQALICLICTLALSFLILLQMNTLTIALGLCVCPLIILYPLMKRITYWPQLFLGITFNFGALMGWAAITGQITLTPILLYIGGIFWTLGYDTIYAHQDKDDDLLAGVKSTALKFGSSSPYWVGGFYTLAFLCIGFASLLAGHSLLNAAGLILPLLHMIWQLWRWDYNSAPSSLQIFKSNRIFGLLVVLAFLL